MRFHIQSWRIGLVTNTYMLPITIGNKPDWELHKIDTEYEEFGPFLDALLSIVQELSTYIYQETDIYWRIRSHNKGDVSSDSDSVIPMFWYIINSMENMQNSVSSQTEFPCPTLTRKFMQINFQTSSSFIPRLAK
ncbi:hypothetical protein HPULCUR_010598 [Helicostylum pulchrum]|uniref:Uncharacterized protein n=1 Tax=Helicostylum pulchrum TaxID=562976 RepID=A0ABP9YEL9_9FUNG